MTSCPIKTRQPILGGDVGRMTLISAEKAAPGEIVGRTSASSWGIRAAIPKYLSEEPKDQR
jgi:hypothetical protein